MVDLGREGTHAWTTGSPAITRPVGARVGSWAISSKGARDEDARLSPVAFASDAGWFESNRIVSARAAGITDPYAGHDEWW